MKKKTKKVLVSTSLVLTILFTSIVPFSQKAYALENDTEKELTELEIDSSEFYLESDEVVEELELKEAPINPEFNKQRSSEEVDSRFGLKVDPLKIHTDYKAIDGANNRQKADNIPASYDLREHNRVTSVKNQGPNGSCWAFASYGSAESVLMPREHMDFSEKNMRNTHGFDWGPKDGGTAAVAAAYLSRWSGPILEKDEPYHPHDFRSPRGLSSVKELEKAMYIPDVRGPNDTRILKEAIMDYGAAYTTVNGSEYYTNMYTMGHYNVGQGAPNHAVTIVGWDDNYSASNFNWNPGGNGAWIVKNSWGPNWGRQGGYYYVSYYDTHIGKNNCIFSLKDKDPNKSVWYYDDLGMTTNIGNGRVGWFSNVFGPTNNPLQISEVGFFVPSNNTRYEVYVNTNIGGDSGFDNRVKVAEGVSEFAGYTTVKFDPREIPSGAYFAPIVKFTTSGYDYPIPIEAPQRGYSSRATSGRGQSYISFDGNRWMDLSSQIGNANVCLKAFTQPLGSKVDVEEDNNLPKPSDNIKITDIVLSPENITMEVGETRTIEALIKPTNASNKKLTWNSSNSNVATITSKGSVKGIAEGNTTISAMTNDGTGISKSINLKVTKQNKVGDGNYFIVENRLLKTELEAGENLTLQINVKDKYGQNLRYASVAVNIDGDINTAKAAYTDGYGNASFTFSTKSLESGDHQLNIRVYGGTYTDNNLTQNFKIKSKKSSEKGSIYKLIETDEAEKLIKNHEGNEEFVILDVRTDAEYLESHIDKSIQYDFYKKDFYDYINKLDKSKTYLIYCRTQKRSGEVAEKMKELGFSNIYWMNGGMTKWLIEKRPSVFPEFEKALDCILSVGNTNYKSGEDVEVNVLVENLSHDYIRNAKATLNLIDSTGKTVHSEDVVMNDTGQTQVKFTLPRDAVKGNYKITGSASMEGYKDGNGLALFTVEDKEVELLSYQERLSRGDFKHLDPKGFELESLNKNYGKNLLKYKVKDAEGNSHQIADLVDLNKKTVLVFGYPGCGPCVDMWKSMSKLKHEDYNFIELVTSVEENMQDTVEFTDRILKDLGIEEFRSHIYYDAEDAIWASRLDFLTTPNTVLLDERGRLVNISGALDAKGLYDLYEKTFDEKIVDNSDEIEDAKLDVNLSLNVITKQVAKGDSIKLVVAAKDKLDKGLAYKDINFKLIDKEGKENSFSSTTNNYGVADCTIDSSILAEGSYSIEVIYVEDPSIKVQGGEIFILPEKSDVIDENNPNPGDKIKTLTFSDRYNKGQLNHILQNDLYYKLQNVYGKNILSYTLTDLEGNNIKISDIVDGNKPTVIGIGYPACGGCQGSWRYLSNIDKSSFNMIEAMTVGSASEIINTLNRLGLSNMSSHFYMNGGSISNLIGANYVPCLIYLDKDGNISNVGYFESNSQVLSIVQSIEGTISSTKKSAPIDDNNDSGDNNPNPGDKIKTLTFSDRYNKGQLNHTLQNDLYYKLQNVYGKNILSYTLTDLEGNNIKISDIVDGNKPTVIGIGYPACGGCQGSWRYLSNIDKSSFNMIEAMTVGSASEIINTLNRLGLSNMSSHFYMNGGSISNLIGANYVPCLIYLDKDGNISNVGYFESNSQVLSIVQSIEGTISSN